MLSVGDAVAPDRATYDHWRLLPAEEQTQRAPDQLILPHPRIQDRAFVLVPLRDIAPNWVHPVLGQSVRDMCEALPVDEIAEVTPL